MATQRSTHLETILAATRATVAAAKAGVLLAGLERQGGASGSSASAARRCQPV